MELVQNQKEGPVLCLQDAVLKLQEPWGEKWAAKIPQLATIRRMEQWPEFQKAVVDSHNAAEAEMQGLIQAHAQLLAGLSAQLGGYMQQVASPWCLHF